MTLWHAISGEWVFLLNPVLWLLWLHPAILFFVLRRKVPLSSSVLLIWVISPLLTWILIFFEYSCVEMIAELLGDAAMAEYVWYHKPDGPEMIVKMLFGWVPSIFLVPFWLIVLLFGSLWWKATRVLCGKAACDDAKRAQSGGSGGKSPQ